MITRIALRNIRKNLRRSISTVLAITTGTIAMLLLGGFIASIYYSVQTQLYKEQGHIHIHVKGYMAYGAVEPENYTLNNYQPLIQLLRDDSYLKDKIAVITPQIKLSGLAGVVATDNSKVFMGLGVIPEDIDQMRKWDGWQLKQNYTLTDLNSQTPRTAMVGFGMARMLGLCTQLKLADCEDPPKLQTQTAEEATPELDDSIAELTNNGNQPIVDTAKHSPDAVALNLLASSSSGLPNIETVYIEGVKKQGLRSVDDMYVMLNFSVAQQLLFGQEPKATQIAVQIKDISDLTQVKAHIQQLLKTYSDKNGQQEYEALTILEIDPSFSNILKMFSFIFGVLSFFLAIVIAVTITNTINMAIMERVNEIGTIRALGFRQNFIVKLFVSESSLIGLIGASLGVILAITFTWLINLAKFQWTPPSNSTPIAIHLLVTENPLLILAVSLFILTLSLLAAILPARRASKMNIVEALNHV